MQLGPGYYDVKKNDAIIKVMSKKKKIVEEKLFLFLIS